MKWTQYSQSSESDSFGPGTDLIMALVSILIIALFFLKLQNVSSEKQNVGRKGKPPIIQLQEVSGFTFKSGSAILSKKFEQQLKKNILPKLEEIVDQYNVNVIEIIGHTDSQIVSSNKRSNLDISLEAIEKGDMSIGDLQYGSNADLGLIRALAVKKFLQVYASPKLRNTTYRVYSAAQLISPGEVADIEQGDSDANRRRIELRFTYLASKKTND